MLNLAGLPNTLGAGTSALPLDPARPRERMYSYHSWGAQSPNGHLSPWFDVLHLFSIEGRVGDPGAWRYRQALFGPTEDRDAQRRTHRVGLAEEQDGDPAPAGRSTFWTGEYAAFFVPSDTGRGAFEVRKAPGVAAQTVTVRVDGEVVGRHSLSGDVWRALSYAVPARDADNSPCCVELLVSPPWRGAGDVTRGVFLRGDL